MFSFDAGLANATPYSAEVFPVELLGRGTGRVQASNGIDTLLDPLVLATIAETTNLVTPRLRTRRPRSSICRNLTGTRSLEGAPPSGVSGRRSLGGSL